MRLVLREETFPIAGRFTIARGSKTEAHVLYVELEDQGCVGRGEAVPYARYGESIAQSVADIEAVRSRIEAGLSFSDLHDLLPAGAARNVIDCALWDLNADALAAGIQETAWIDLVHHAVLPPGWK